MVCQDRLSLEMTTSIIFPAVDRWLHQAMVYGPRQGAMCWSMARVDSGILRSKETVGLMKSLDLILPRIV